MSERYWKIAAARAPRGSSARSYSAMARSRANPSSAVANPRRSTADPRRGCPRGHLYESPIVAASIMAALQSRSTSGNRTRRRPTVKRRPAPARSAHPYLSPPLPPPPPPLPPPPPPQLWSAASRQRPALDASSCTARAGNAFDRMLVAMILCRDPTPCAEESRGRASAAPGPTSSAQARRASSSSLVQQSRGSPVQASALAVSSKARETSDP